MGLPTIPEYFKKYVNPNIDLETENSIPCPFHKEVHGKSFTYSPSKKIFRCWGACHTGGDVIELHRLTNKIKTREEAKISLYEMCGVDMRPTFTKRVVTANPEEVKERVAYANALRAAKTLEDWVELDYIMSFYPLDVNRLEVFTNVRNGGNK